MENARTKDLTIWNVSIPVFPAMAQKNVPPKSICPAVFTPAIPKQLIVPQILITIPIVLSAVFPVTMEIVSVLLSIIKPTVSLMK